MLCWLLKHPRENPLTMPGEATSLISSPLSLRTFEQLHETMTLFNFDPKYADLHNVWQIQFQVEVFLFVTYNHTGYNHSEVYHR